MATWSDIAAEIDAITTPDKCDVVRRNKLSTLHQLTGRNTVIYATDFLDPNKVRMSGGAVGLELSDKEGFVEVTDTLPAGNLDVVLHSPGGIAEAAESIVEILRDKFTDIRFIVPSIAKSAATMLAMSGNTLVIDERSELGPTDPQMQVNRDGHIVRSPAHAVKEQFKLAQSEIVKDPQKLSPWLPILRQYGPSLLAECDTSLDLSKQLVTKWLKTYMFSGQRNSGKKASVVANYLRSSKHLTHGRRIGINELTAKGVKILDMRTDVPLRTAVWDLHLAITQTFARTGAYKIFENHTGKALVRSIQLIPITQQGNNHP